MKQTLRLRSLAASIGAACLLALSPNAQSPQHCGSGTVTSLMPVDGACLDFHSGRGTGPDRFDVRQGSTYVMTISGITECEGEAITVILQVPDADDLCFNAFGGNGSYFGIFTVPNPSCGSMNIRYKCGADAECSSEGSIRAQGPESGCRGAQIRTALFNGSCQFLEPDTECDPCPLPATAEPMNDPCHAELIVSPPYENGITTATYDGNLFGGVALFYYSEPSTPVPFLGCELFLGDPAFLAATALLDGNGDAMISVPNRQHPCGMQLMVQAFGVDSMFSIEVSNAVLLTFGS